LGGDSLNIVGLGEGGNDGLEVAGKKKSKLGDNLSYDNRVIEKMVYGGEKLRGGSG